MPLWYSKIRSYTRTTQSRETLFFSRSPPPRWVYAVSRVAFLRDNATTNHGTGWLRRPLPCTRFSMPHCWNGMTHRSGGVKITHYCSFLYIYYSNRFTIINSQHNCFNVVEVNSSKIFCSSYIFFITPNKWSKCTPLEQRYKFACFGQVNRTESSRPICTTSLRVRTYKQVS